MRGLRVVVVNWRDTRHPEGGGSERYVESIARTLAEAGHHMTIVCAEHAHAPRDETVHGVRFVRRGGKLSVYPRAWWLLRSGRLGTVDVVVDVQNGIPFWTRTATAAPVVVLVHHVHREQWPVVYGPLASRFGWWLESKVAPRFYRSCQYVTVSDVSRRELESLGVEHGRIAVVHNGTDHPERPLAGRSAAPTIVVLGRLVPHKRIEHVVDAARELAPSIDDLRVVVVGDGWWQPRLEEYVRAAGMQDVVRLTGFVDESTKHRLLDEAWVMAAPSLKEGWGLCVMEAAAHGVPTVAYGSAGGLAESVVDGSTGLLAHDHAEFTEALRRLLVDPALRTSLGERARKRSAGYRWETASSAFLSVLDAVVVRHALSDATDQASEESRVDRASVATLAHETLTQKTPEQETRDNESRDREHRG